MPTKYRHYQILKHDFSLPLMKLSHCCVVACIDYPECDDTITVFGDRD